MIARSASGELFEIRPVDTDELEALLDVYRQCEDFLALGPVATASAEMVKQDLALSQKNGSRYCGIFLPEGKLIGVVDYLESGYAGDSTAGFIELLMIAADYRNRGIGQAVAGAVERQVAATAGVNKLLAGVQVNNPQALAFWQRQGFRIIRGPQLLADQTIVYTLQKDFAFA